MKIYMKVQILEENQSERRIRGKLHDGTPFDLNVPFWDVAVVQDCLEDGNPVGWLEVELLGQRNGLTWVALPSPVLSMGHNVTVLNNRTRKKL